MSYEDYEMALSKEGLVLIVLGTIAFIFAFVDLSQSAFAFPALVFFILGWGLVRFRRRPLPKQIHETRNLYMAHIKSLRNYHLFEIIFLNILQLFQYNDPTSFLRASLIFNYFALLMLSIIEFIGNFTISDSLELFPKMKEETEKEWRKKRFQILYGSKFFTWIIITTILGLGFSTLSFLWIMRSGITFVIIMQFVLLGLGIALFYYLYKDTMNYRGVLPFSFVLKAVDYYNESDLRKLAYGLLDESLDLDPNNVPLLSKYATMAIEDSNYDNVLSLTTKIINNIKEQDLDAPHILSKAYLLRGLSFRAKEEYSKAFKAVTSSLSYTPSNQVARRMRSELRSILRSRTTEEESLPLKD